jgi:hypothetical protein
MSVLYQGTTLGMTAVPAATEFGCPTSRSFFARCGFTTALNPKALRLDPHLAKNERDVGHPSFVAAGIQTFSAACKNGG